MTNAEISSLFEFNDWANARTFEAIGALTPEQQTKDNGSSFPSILATAAHIVGAEWIWLERWKGTPSPAFPDWLKTVEFGDLVSRLRTVEADRSAYLAGLPADAGALISSFKLLNGTEDTQPLHVMIRHVVNHSTYHRGQIAAFSRQFGVKPPTTDYIAFARLQGK